MSSVLELYNESSVRLQREFLICDFCFWAASAICIRKHDMVTCPQCKSAVSRIPISDNESFTFSYDKKRGVELAFESSRR